MQTSALRYYFFFWLHVIIILAWYLSPFYLPWWVVVITVALYHYQLYRYRGCLITKGQFGHTNEGFYMHYLRKLGFNPDRKKLSFVLDIIIPGLLIVIAIFLQLILPVLK